MPLSHPWPVTDRTILRVPRIAHCCSRWITDAWSPRLKMWLRLVPDTPPRAPMITGTIVIFLFQILLSSAAKGRYLLIFSCTFSLTLWSNGTLTSKSSARSSRTSTRSGLFAFITRSVGMEISHISLQLAELVTCTSCLLLGNPCCLHSARCRAWTTKLCRAMYAVRARAGQQAMMWSIFSPGAPHTRQRSTTSCLLWIWRILFLVAITWSWQAMRKPSVSGRIVWDLKQENESCMSRIPSTRAQ